MKPEEEEADDPLAALDVDALDADQAEVAHARADDVPDPVKETT